ncbi:hypothetical protein ACLOJK_022977, partial [Asimina triloba]
AHLPHPNPDGLKPISPSSSSSNPGRSRMKSKHGKIVQAVQWPMPIRPATIDHGSSSHEPQRKIQQIMTSGAISIRQIEIPIRTSWQ